MDVQGSRREKLVERLRSYNQALGAPLKALENIESLSSAGARVIVTGQQPGLFTGPLYTIYKAISAIVIAERFSNTGKGRFIPLFWNHSADHDFAEVNHIYLLKDNRPIKLEYPSPEADSRPKSVAEIALDEERVSRLISQIAEATPQSEFKNPIINRVRELAHKSHDFGDFFSQLMLWLFGEQGLVLVEPRHLRELMAPIFTRLIEEPQATGRLVAQAGERLKREGQASPLHQPEWFCNFFIDRRRVAYRDGRFSIEGESLSREELLELLREEPHRFSSDVVTRPLIQDWLFPTCAYVAGPHEAAYLAQLREVYHLFSLEMPQIIPRHRATLVEQKIGKIIERYAPGVDQLEDYRQPERLMRQIVSASTDLGSTFARCRDEIASVLEEIEEYASQIDPQLRRPSEAAEAKIAKILSQLEEKVAKAKREREPLLKEQIYRAANHLFPLGRPQERALNIVEFLIRHGLVLLEWLKERFAGAEPGEHLVIDLPVG